MSSDTKFQQIDFSGGLNTNSAIGLNELSECTNIDLHDFGVAKPVLADDLILPKTNVDCLGVLDGTVYFTIGTYLYVMKGGVTELGDIGASRFYCHKMNGVHLIISTSKAYKVINNTLYKLGVDAPTTSPTVALVAQNTTEIEDFEAASEWTATGLTVADDPTNKKVGTNALQLTSVVAGAIEYAQKALSVNLSEFSDGTASLDDDLIEFWVYIADVTKFTYLQLFMDCNTGDFKNDYYYKTIPIMPLIYNAATNEDDFTTTYTTPQASIEDIQHDWFANFLGADTADLSDFTIPPNWTGTQYKKSKKTPVKDSPQTAQTSSTFTLIKIRKSDFVRFGETVDKDWSTIAAIRFQLMSNAVGCVVSLDDMQLVGGGHLNGDYKVSYSYVARFTLDDGTTYEEESKLSPEVEVTDAEQQDISITTIADSTDTSVTHKRIYIRGENLINRYQAGEIADGTTTFTVDDSEIDLVVLSTEDCRKNALPPTSPIHSAVSNGKLFILSGKNLYFSRTNQPSAFRPLDYIELPYSGVALMENGSNISVLMGNQEVIYVNAGYTPENGGYLYYIENPQGCIASASAVKGFYATHEGIAYLAGQKPVIVSQRIRNELLSYILTDSEGAYLRGSYYLCIPRYSVMFQYDTITDRFIKYDGITGVADGDDGSLYVKKTTGIYKLKEEDTQKSFYLTTPELLIPDDMQYRNLIVDINTGGLDVNVQYLVNGTAKTSYTVNTSARQRKLQQVTQEAGARVKVRVYKSTDSDSADIALHGVWLQ